MGDYVNGNLYLKLTNPDYIAVLESILRQHQIERVATFNYGEVIAIEYNTDQYPELSEFEKMLLEFEYKGQKLVERVEGVPITGVPEKPINNTSQTG